MNINHLKYFVVIAEEQNFTAAAKKLYVTQPSLSQSIQSIERQVGAELLNRSQNPVSLTPAGEIFYAWAKQVIAMKDDMDIKIKDISQNAHIVLRVGTSSEQARTLVVPVVKKLRELLPNCLVDIHEVTASELHRMLEDNDIDVAVGKAEPDQYLYVSERICREYPVLAVPVSFANELPEKVRNSDVIDLCDLKDFPFVSLSREQTYGNYFRQCCSALGFIPDIAAECRTLAVVHNLVRSGVGAGLVTNALMVNNADYENVRYYNLLNLPGERTIYVVRKNTSYTSESIKTFISLLREESTAPAE